MYPDSVIAKSLSDCCLADEKVDAAAASPDVKGTGKEQYVNDVRELS